jgi:hypothetical protein
MEIIPSTVHYNNQSMVCKIIIIIMSIIYRRHFHFGGRFAYPQQ